jgi:hypothetical protein
MNPLPKGITMTDLPKTAVITIKIINALDKKFDRFRK